MEVRWTDKKEEHSDCCKRKLFENAMHTRRLFNSHSTGDVLWISGLLLSFVCADVSQIYTDKVRT